MMKTRIFKEVRALLPAWGLAVALLVVALPQISNGNVEWDSWTSWLVFSCAMLGTVTFGHEFHHQTMALLLAQGVDRRRIWWEKMLVLGIGLGTVYGLSRFSLWTSGVNLNVPDSSHAMEFLWLIPVAAFCTAPFWTLVARSGLGAILFTVMFPPMMFGVLALLGEKIAPSFFHEPANDSSVVRLIQAQLLVYAVIVHRWGYAMFRRWDAVRDVNQEVQLPQKASEFFSRLLERCWQGHHGMIAALIKKEIRLHKLAFVMTGAFCAACLLLVLLREVGGFEWADSGIMAAIAIYMITLPMVLGAVSTAEERSLGILESQLMLPVGARRQWIVKCLATFGLCLLLGVVLPALTVLLARVPVSPGLLQVIKLQDLGGVIGAEMLLLALSMYASTLAHNAIRGLLLGVTLWAAVASLFKLVGTQGAKWALLHPISATSVEAYDRWMELPPRLEIIGGYVLALLAFRLAYTNYRMNDWNRRRLAGHAFAAFCVIVLWAAPPMIINQLDYPPVHETDL